MRAHDLPTSNLEALFDEHLECEFAHRDVDATMDTMVAEPYVYNIASMTGGFGRDGVRHFYSRHFIPQIPKDARVTPRGKRVSVFRHSLLVASLLIFATATAIAAPPTKGMMLPPQPKVRPAGLPADVVMVSPCVATMGEHWVNLKNAPTGPIYGTYEGKPVFTEIMVTVDQLKKGFSWADIRALPGYTIDHVDVAFEPHGHAGLPVPHYDVHAYYVSPVFEAKICPNGLPDEAMKPTNLK